MKDSYTRETQLMSSLGLFVYSILRIALVTTTWFVHTNHRDDHFLYAIN